MVVGEARLREFGERGMRGACVERRGEDRNHATLGLRARTHRPRLARGRVLEHTRDETTIYVYADARQLLQIRVGQVGNDPENRHDRRQCPAAKNSDLVDGEGK